jgi:hypothetical protein
VVRAGTGGIVSSVVDCIFASVGDTGALFGPLCTEATTAGAEDIAAPLMVQSIHLRLGLVASRWLEHPVANQGRGTS